MRRLDVLEQRADELATDYLNERLDSAKSASTVITERSALRHFFDNRDLAEHVVIPERKRF